MTQRDGEWGLWSLHHMLFLQLLPILIPGFGIFFLSQKHYEYEASNSYKYKYRCQTFSINFERQWAHLGNCVPEINVMQLSLHTADILSFANCFPDSTMWMGSLPIKLWEIYTDNIFHILQNVHVYQNLKKSLLVSEFQILHLSQKHFPLAKWKW